MPRIVAAALVVCALAGCSSDRGSSSSGTSSSASSATTSTLDAAASSSLDVNGAKAYLTLYFAPRYKAADPTVTQAEVDCVPDAVLARMTSQELFAIVDAARGLSLDEVAKVTDALRSCGLTDDQIAKVPLS